MPIKRLKSMNFRELTKKLNALGYHLESNNKHYKFINGNKSIVLTSTCKGGVQLVVLMKELKKNGISIEEFNQV